MLDPLPQSIQWVSELSYPKAKEEIKEVSLKTPIKQLLLAVIAMYESVPALKYSGRPADPAVVQPTYV